MTSLLRHLKKLPSVKFLEKESQVADSFWLPQGGLIAYSGALRVFPSRPARGLPSFESWNAADGWRREYAHLTPLWPSIGEDAFGDQYLLAPGGEEIAVFYAESGEVDRIEASPAELFEMIAADPDGTISLSFYNACVRRYGRLPLDQHFAFQVELIIGGEQIVDNAMLMPAQAHMHALGKIAIQVYGLPVGTPLTPVLEE